MALLTDEVRKHIGAESTPFPACDPVEKGAVRRYAQAIMDPDPAYASDEAGARYGGAVAPPPPSWFRVGPRGTTRSPGACVFRTVGASSGRPGPDGTTDRAGRSGVRGCRRTRPAHRSGRGRHTEGERGGPPAGPAPCCSRARTRCG